MSKIALTPNASGTGIFTIAAPNSNTDRTLTLPDATGTVNISGLANQVPAGSAGAPAIYPTGDTNTGIFFPAADTIAFAEGGVESMRITSTGAVGIATNSPTATLQVNGSLKYDSSVTGGNGLNVVAAWSYNNNSGNTIGAMNFGFCLIAIHQGNGLTVLPMFLNAGGGVAWTGSLFDPDNANFVYGAGPTVSFATAGTSANSYTLSMSGPLGIGTITRTAGSAAYTVYVLALVS